MAARTYTDAQLGAAVAESRSWRGVLRALDLTATSAAAIRSVRRRADQLGLDHGHFTGQRRYSDEELAVAVASCGTWVQVAEQLGLAGGSSTTSLKGHAARLGLDGTHLTRSPGVRPAAVVMKPDPTQLPRAGPQLAAARFTMCGYDVSWPLEPCPYDLLVSDGGRFLRIQVKTTRLRAGKTWVVTLLAGGRSRGSYDPDSVDYFFVIDGELRQYLIPVAAVGGRQAVHVSSYAEYLLPALALTGASTG